MWCARCREAPYHSCSIARRLNSQQDILSNTKKSTIPSRTFLPLSKHPDLRLRAFPVPIVGTGQNNSASYSKKKLDNPILQDLKPFNIALWMISSTGHTIVPLEDEIDPLDCESHEWVRLEDLLEDPLCCLLLDLCGFCNCVSSEAAWISYSKRDVMRTWKCGSLMQWPA